ncbi:MAG: hypothetical protein NC483_00280 [Ruminococcus sp.]|nr:hypothetical protein [Ruminococcus sp.]
MKDKVIGVGFVLILFIFSLAFLFIEDKEISFNERRKLATKEVLKEDFIDNLDDYMKDQFLLRDSFISLNSIYDRYILNIIDSNDVYVSNNYIIEKNYPLNEASVNNFIKKLNYINDTYLKNSKVYYAVIPDKGYYLDDNKYLKLDYNYIFNKLKKEININYIDITNVLNLEDYYKTDIHIKQESYFNVIEELGYYLNFNYKKEEYDTLVYNSFYGSSYRKVPIFIRPDKMKILSNEVIENALVKHLEYGEKSIYELEKLNSMDSYNIYLGGPSAFIEIENKLATTDRELIIFRDSFASSLTPLLLDEYKKITLIDLRYIKMDLVSNYVDFNNKDVLLLYSTLIVNSSNLLKV